MMQTFNITVEGFWRDKFKHGVPTYPGIFFVYETKYNISTDTVSLIRLLYVGGAVNNIRDKIAGHPFYTEWTKCLREGNELSYSAANIEPANITQLKAAFIKKFQPPVNTDYKGKFLFGETTIFLSGKTNLLEPGFTISTS